MADRMWLAAWWAGCVLGLAVLTVGCEAPSGPVEDRRATCRETDSRPLCTYELKVDGEWFETIRTTYDRCSVREQYPDCRRGN